MRSPRIGAAALLGTAVLAAGCSSSVVGTAEHAGPAGAGPLAELLAQVEVDAEVDGHVRLADVAATPDGGFVVLLTGDLASNHRSVFVELVPGDGELAVGEVTEGPPAVDLGEVHVASDGTVVALAPVVPADTSGEGREQDLALIVLEPGSDEPDLRRIAADPELGTPDLGTGVLSPDGGTLYASLRWPVDGDTVNRLAAVDVATGEVTASAPLGVETPGTAIAYDVALRPDGGLAALVTTDRDPEGDVDGAVLVQYDAGLQPLGDPVEVVDEEESTGYALAVLPDGAVVVSVVAGEWDTGEPRLVTVRDGAVQATTVLPGTGVDLAVEPGGQHVYLAHGRPGAGSGVATVDLATGGTVADVPTCADGSPDPLALAADGRTLAATAACHGDDDTHELAFLLG
ncbi:hypothetical protein JD79_02679 [Geodermatophilus normandii]|uniref:Uncharacterized protein n=1 Tax=Geodermatophilus normandii TaxID=1137989 RepID=A0A317QMS7_9ACTN|nr:hypothetical protein [Geodermatophilus normandii]PWW23505.1 hypothetical protein JD79_02679 [Geodermatophilus normandii]